MDTAVEQAKVEERHRLEAEKVVEGGDSAAIWTDVIELIAQALANFEAKGREKGYQEAVDSVADWHEPEPPDHSWRD